MSDLPWNERVNMLSIHPDAATREDVAKLAAENISMKLELEEAEGLIREIRITLDYLRPLMVAWETCEEEYNRKDPVGTEALRLIDNVDTKAQAFLDRKGTGHFEKR